jgi:hypothetical protein
MKKISTTKRTRNPAASHPFGLILKLIGLISLVTVVSDPVALAQVSGAWILTGSMNTPRSDHTATLLPSGKVLVVGGDQIGNSAELYDPATGTWSITGSLNTPRFGHTATLLPNGKVLVAGGADNFADFTLASAEIYDPATGTWTITGSLNTPRALHTATLLQDGRVLVASGTDPEEFVEGSALASAEIYDPATEMWSNTGDQNDARFYHTATLLPNGKVLVAGGAYPGPPVGPAPAGAFKLVGLKSAELYDPATGRWSYTGELNTLHAFHTATLLPNGRVLVAAGTDSISNYPTDNADTNIAELYDLATESWSITCNLNVARDSHTATLLQNGQVLVAGGYTNSVELYNNGVGSCPTPLTLAAPVLPDAEVGVPYGAPLVNGGLPPYTVNIIKGVFPQGLSDTLAIGRLSGTPASSRSRSFTVQITDDLGSSVTGTFGLKIFPALGKTTRTLKAGINGKPYKATLKAAGGNKPYNWSLVSGNLPTGLTLDSLTGVIAGIPTETGAFDLIFHATDSLGGIAETELTLTIR